MFSLTARYFTAWLYCFVETYQTALIIVFKLHLMCLNNDQNLAVTQTLFYTIIDYI